MLLKHIRIRAGNFNLAIRMGDYRVWQSHDLLQGKLGPQHFHLFILAVNFTWREGRLHSASHEPVVLNLVIQRALGGEKLLLHFNVLPVALNPLLILNGIP